MFNNNISTLPAVSVIVPAYNVKKGSANLIESLLNLDYPKELLQIIIVDNNSTDQTKEVVRHYPLKLLEENNIQSSYAARNLGINNATGEILAFTDADCIAISRQQRVGLLPHSFLYLEILRGITEGSGV